MSNRAIAPVPRWTAAVAAGGAALLALSACTATTPGSDPTDAAAVTGGTLTFAVGTDAGCIDPQQVGSGDTISSLRQTVDSLTDQDPATGELVPWLAESWDVNADATEFTFHLRPGVTFSDGTPLTAEVIKANFDAIPDLGPLAVLATGYIAGYAGTEVVDDLTAVVTFDAPNAQFLQSTSTANLAPVSLASTELSPEDRCSEGVIGTGAFVLDEYVPNQSITLVKRTGYDWGSALWTKQGEAYLDELVFTVIPESGVRIGAITSGQVDLVRGVAQADEATLEGAGIVLESRAVAGILFNLGLNVSRPLLQDQTVRQALLTAVDREEIVEAVFPTGAQAATSILSHTTPGYTDLGSELDYDPDRSAELLDEAGWTLGSNGIREKDGVKLSLVVVWFENAAAYLPALELFQQQLAQVGVHIEIKGLQVSEFPDLLGSGDFDGLWGNDLTRADPDALRTIFSSEGLNAYRLPASELDGLLADIAATGETEQRFALAAEAQRFIIEHAYAVPISEQQAVFGVSPTVHDVRIAVQGVNFHDAWKER